MRFSTSRTPFSHICYFWPMALASQARRVIIVIAVMTFALSVALSVAAKPMLSQPFDPRVKAQRLTQSLVALNARLQRAGALERPKLLDALLALAAERRELLISLLDDDPDAASQVLLPPNLRDRFPDAVTRFLEFKTEIAGEFQVLHVDYDDASLEKNLYVLQTVLGERFSLHAADKLPSLMSGVRGKVKGMLFQGKTGLEIGSADGAVLLASGVDNLTLLASGGDNDPAASNILPPAGEYAIGEQKTLVMLVNFQDKPGEQPWSFADVGSTVFGSASGFFMENSFGQAWLTGDVVGWYTIAMDSTLCDYWGLSTLADEAAAANGIDLAAYRRRVYAFPQNGCSWGGLSTIGGSTSWSWLNGGVNLRITSHELGHAIGLWHSRGLECGSDIISDSCLLSAYGDTFDVMGRPNSGHFNAFQKEQLGWLGYHESPPMTTVAINGIYEIEPYESDGIGSKALKILRSIDSVTGLKTWYYVEHRQAFGFDAFLAGNENVLNGVIIHRGAEGAGDEIYLLDMTPESYTKPGSDFNDAALTVGESFLDLVAGVTITLEDVDSNGATVHVSMTPLPCAPANPRVSLSPSEGQWVEPGVTVTYSVTVTNHDSATCAPASFDLSAMLPVGWSSNLADANLTLAPGASAVTTLDVTSLTSAVNGFYDIRVMAVNHADAAYAGSAVAAYVVSATLNQPPVSVSDDVSTAENSPVNIDVLANDSDPDGDPLTVAAASNGSHGQVAINLDHTLTYTPNSNYYGADSFTYDISDGNGGVSTAIVRVTVTEVNEPPIAVDDVIGTSKGVPVTIDVLANDSDPDGDILSVASVTQGVKGVVVVNGDGTLTYTPQKSFKGDSFTYVISDGSSTARATVAITDVSSGGNGNSGKGRP